jgi:DNA polymerase
MAEVSELSNLIADIREQVLYFQELGVDSLAVDLPSEPAAPIDPSPVAARHIETRSSLKPPQEPAVKRAPGSRLSSLPSLSGRPSIDPSQNASDKVPPATANQSATAEQVKAEQPLIDVSPKLSETADTIESIRAEIGNCTRCPLHAMGRKQIVHSTGNFNAELMFVGEAPGADEDDQGFPFVGRAGQLLTKIIESIGMKREDVFIGNINRCRPPGNRQPEPNETAECRPFILREIAVVQPKVIVVLGATAAQNLLEVKTPISKLRGHFHEYFGVKVMPTFHPAYLLRDPNKKREVWEDMKKVRDLLNSYQANR